MDLQRRRDARSLDHGTLEEMRRLAVRRVKNGESQKSVALGLEVHARTVSKWVVVERKEGAVALASRKATGRPPGLTKKEREEVLRLIVGKTPLQLSFGTALWTVPVLQDVLAKRFGKALHATTVLRTLRRLGLTPQKPTRRAFQRDEEACRTWATEGFPAIVRQARRQQATLLFGDEAGVHEDGPLGRTWGLKGQRPVVRLSGWRRRLNVISAISPRGRLWFRCYKGTLTSPVFIAFLQALLHDVRGRVVLILDRHPAHVAAATRRWLLAHHDRIVCHYLPAYAPEMNPDEHVWSQLKGLFRRTPVLATEDFDLAVENAMLGIVADRSLVRSFFGHPDVAYVKQALHW
jgi:transposase